MVVARVGLGPRVFLQRVPISVATIRILRLNLADNASAQNSTIMVNRGIQIRSGQELAHLGRGCADSPQKSVDRPDATRVGAPGLGPRALGRVVAVLEVRKWDPGREARRAALLVSDRRPEGESLCRPDRRCRRCRGNHAPGLNLTVGSDATMWTGTGLRGDRCRRTDTAF